jgi:hypothetical protein
MNKIKRIREGQKLRIKERDLHKLLPVLRGRIADGRRRLEQTQPLVQAYNAGPDGQFAAMARYAHQLTSHSLLDEQSEVDKSSAEYSDAVKRLEETGPDGCSLREASRSFNIAEYHNRRRTVLELDNWCHWFNKELDPNGNYAHIHKEYPGRYNPLEVRHIWTDSFEGLDNQNFEQGYYYEDKSPGQYATQAEVDYAKSYTDRATLSRRFVRQRPLLSKRDPPATVELDPRWIHYPKPKTDYRHPNVSCDGCHQGIYGLRFKCKVSVFDYRPNSMLIISNVPITISAVPA